MTRVHGGHKESTGTGVHSDSMYIRARPRAADARIKEAGRVRLALLALLARHPAYGYQLRTALAETFGSAYPQPNIGQIYVTLGRLEEKGLIQGEAVSQSGRPDKRVYEITEAGRAALAEWLDQPAVEPRLRDDFFMKLVLAPAAGAADPQELIDLQRRSCVRAMRDLSRLAAGKDRGNKVAQLLVEGALLHLQADLDWLERCQEELA
jgi:DNA-binding PadR family transcriptional regulator